MKSATTVVALVLTLLVWVSVAAAQRFPAFDIVDYNIPTPAPDGVASCTLLVSATKAAGARGRLGVVLVAEEGEAQIPELGLGSGVQDGCDIFPEVPLITRLDLDTSVESFTFNWTMDVHAHPDADCEAGGTAEGLVVVGIVAFGGGQVGVSLSCE